MGLGKRLVRHGNSLALIIDRPLLRLLGIGRNTLLEMRVDGRKLTIAPADAKPENPEFEEALAKANVRYGETLRRLAAEERGEAESEAGKEHRPRTGG